MTELLRPSQVIDKKPLEFPEGNIVESDEEWNRCGEWTLYHPHADMEFVDSAWVELQQLLDGGIIIKLKAMICKNEKEGPLILCYTRPGKQEAKRAAEAIRRVVDFKGIMYYKLNEHTYQRIAHRFGHKRVTIYMHTYCGGFYVKKNGSWIQDSEDAEEKTVPIANIFCKENYSGNENLPSTQKGRCFWNLPENHQYEQTGYANWYLFCSCEDEGPYVSEVDRVWLVAKQLLEEGLFVGISVIMKPKEDKQAQVRLYLSPSCDVYSRLAACDRIFKEASSRTVMYFVQTRKIMHINKEVYREPISEFVYTPQFVYTPDGELYKKTEYSDEYLFKREKD